MAALYLVADQGPQLVQVHNGRVVLVGPLVEVPHTNLQQVRQDADAFLQHTRCANTLRTWKHC